MAKTPKYPNPAFFRTKNNMDWKAQGENLKEVFDIAKDMLLATDWKAFSARQKQGWIDFGKRVAEEAAEIAAMSCAERRHDNTANEESQQDRQQRHEARAKRFFQFFHTAPPLTCRSWQG